MEDKRLLYQNFCATAAALVSLCVASLLAGCAANSYAGIPFAAGAADPEFQGLATRARGGDKQARFDLAERSDYGRSLTRDPARARQLYTSAARDTKKRMSLYIATPGGRSASIQREFAETRFDGLAEAKLRLLALDESDAKLPRTLGQDFEIRDRDVVREKGMLLYGYQPIFNGLKSSKKPRRKVGVIISWPKAPCFRSPRKA